MLGRVQSGTSRSAAAGQQALQVPPCSRPVVAVPAVILSPQLPGPAPQCWGVSWILLL